MLCRWARFTLLIIALSLALWSIARPARAAAPMCDRRGAITFAPPPTVQAPFASVDVGECQADCAWEKRADPVLDRAHASRRMEAPSELMAFLPTALALGPPATARSVERARSVVRPPAGVRVRIDRPPRAGRG